MEIIEYEYPTSWGSKGMNWENPDPEKADYMMALRLAVEERVAATGAYVSRRVFEISPKKAVSLEFTTALLDAIYSLAPNFVNMEFDDYKDDLSDYPKMWTYGDLIKEDEPRLCDSAWRGMPCRDGGKWLRAMKNALDRLTVIKCNKMYGTTLGRSGAVHDPPFEESINTALERAMENATESKYSGSFPVDVTAWSGNTHWCPPEEGREDSGDGYCGYAESRSYSVSRIDNWLKDSVFNLLIASRAARPTGPVAYSQELSQAVYDSGKSGLKEGVTFLDPIQIKDASKVELNLGEVETIPKNSNVPVSDFNEDEADVRRSTKIGYTARLWGLMDYGVEGGFKFRKEA